MPLSPGDKLGPYEILAPLGAGGMGEVYKARDTRLDRTVAIKVLPEHIARREDLRARFEREARAVASLNHPNICTLYDIGNRDGAGYMVMEYALPAGCSSDGGRCGAVRRTPAASTAPWHARHPRSKQ